ncbi:O-antigen ligase family protein [Croceicoccus gelatinilyticus]|uniref:O-antigen ligase family protein n=1 Tax=Croceicoccus gelatinilyticus TaxID=2835536 RepID=UPI001BCB18F7|nr:O-antigen ligase family protein [Croceicoccus gelatinilyticus]MBS7668932.1 hypothetical protein [Croceicoccus gelatinilyticus]
MALLAFVRSRVSVESAPLYTLLIVAALVGGGGSPDAFPEAIVIITALACGGAVLAYDRGRGGRISRHDWALALALPALALIQIVPIPFRVRESLPFGETLRMVLRVGGPVPFGWPMSIDPASTIWSGLSLLAPAVAFLLALRLPAEARAKVSDLLFALALLSAAIAIVQAATGAWQFYSKPAGGGAPGLFANQNSQGDLLLIGLCAALSLAGKGDPQERLHPGLMVAVVIILTLGLLLTGSRAALGLSLIPLSLAAFVSGSSSNFRRTALLVMAGCTLPFVAFLCDFGPFSRPDIALDPRLQAIWPDALRLAALSFPWGTGLGTFEHAFPMVESLSVVDATYANRAHSDWLEFLIEAGGFAVLLTGWVTVRVVKSMTTLLKLGFDCGDLVPFAVLAIVGLHALVDYPFRSLSLAVVSAAALGLMLSAERGVANEE